MKIGESKTWYKVCYYDELTHRVRYCEVLSIDALPEIIKNMRTHQVGVFVTRCTEEVLDCDQFIGQEIDTKIL